MLKRVLVGAAVLVVVLGAIATFYVTTNFPAQRPAPDVTIEPTAALIDRGAYLVSAVVPCADCHSPTDTSRYGNPRNGPLLSGGMCFGAAEGVAGQVCGWNLTPDPAHGIGAWSDGEILRAVREGVNRNGEGLFPMMPYSEFSSLSDADAHAVIAYLRTVPAVSTERPRRSLGFSTRLATWFAPQPLNGRVAEPDRADPVAYGAYLTKVAGCAFCHTAVDSTMAPIPGMEFAGGQAFPLPSGRTVVSSNLTPHTTGIGGLTRENLIGLFRAFQDVEAVAVHDPEGRNTVMPWFIYTNMTDDDLTAIYSYLRTLTPIENVVDTWPAGDS